VVVLVVIAAILVAGASIALNHHALAAYFGDGSTCGGG
jgi:hypothetical protein